METAEAVRTVTEVAHRLVALCRSGQYDAAQRELYAENARSVEPAHSQWPVAEGLDAIVDKGHQWAESVKEFHGSEVSEPVVAGNFFSVALTIDATYTNEQRFKMEEICVYQVENGKIVLEQFFY